MDANTRTLQPRGGSYPRTDSLRPAPDDSAIDGDSTHPDPRLVFAKTLAGLLADDDSLASIHPDLKMAQIKRSLAGVFERELGHQASVLEARVQDCVNLVVLRNVLREVITLVAQRKSEEAADRIALLVKRHGPF
jgi:hypothetical protein